MAHSQLTLAQRYKIYAYLQANISKSRIATLLNVHRSTVYREIKRNTVQGKYHPEKAHQAFKERKHNAKSQLLCARLESVTGKLILQPAKDTKTITIDNGKEFSNH